MARRRGWLDATTPSSPKKSGNPQGDRGFFSVLGGDRNFYLALLYIENRISRVALRENLFILLQTKGRPAQAGFREKGLRIENRPSILPLRHCALTTRTLGNSVGRANLRPHRRKLLAWAAADRSTLGLHLLPPNGQHLQPGVVPSRTGDMRPVVPYSKTYPRLISSIGPRFRQVTVRFAKL